ncbi:nucleoside/nucleotide kinase family protein [Sphaerisporangium corydalis]|uniref:Guanylate kinase n=1 Tax=Sphaerisporangium corydalis TaxID=1441875 RepID=A0ABV9EUA8_9ACTN|nr:guanylate kinase [Sphaerisporangium corydalis]
MTQPTGIVLYGPPTSGKSTTTTALHRFDPRFRLLRKLKVGTGRAEEYHLVTAARFDELRQAGRTVAETHRYGNTYAVDRAEVEEMAQAGRIPVAHMGTIADLRRLVGRDPWLRVLLWVPRDVCEQRSGYRGDVDTTQRLTAWDETLADLEAGADEGFFHLRLHTDQISVDQAAREIAAAYQTLSASSLRAEGPRPVDAQAPPAG